MTINRFSASFRRLFRETRNRNQVADDRNSDGKIAQPQLKLQTVHALGHSDCADLSHDSDPTQQNHRAQPYPAGTALRCEKAKVFGQAC